MDDKTFVEKNNLQEKFLKLDLSKIKSAKEILEEHRKRRTHDRKC